VDVLSAKAVDGRTDELWLYQYCVLQTSNDVYKQRSKSFILVPIDSLYTTSYRLSIVILATGRTD